MKEYFCDISAVTDGELECWYYQMDPSRQEKCRRLKKADAKKLCIAADHLARFALSEHLGCPPEEIKIVLAPSGKPYIEGNPVYFSLSHSGRIAACVLSETPIGIDIERIRRIPEAVQKRICTRTEWEYLQNAENEKERTVRFIAVWTRKEAIFKMDGRLPRRDPEIETLHPSDGLSLKTKITDQYAISVAKRQNL